MSENPPAFPNTGNSTWSLQPAEGMTLRDWFAGQALPSALVGATDLDTMTPNERKQIWGSVAGIMYELADAMIAERAK